MKREALGAKRCSPQAGFSELLIQIGLIVSMALIETRLESFCHHLEFMLKSIGQNGGVPFDLDDFSPKGFSSSTDDLLNVRQRFLVHNPSR